MEDRIKNWHHEIDEITERFIRNFSSLISEQLNWKPHPTKWSIGQVVEHLIRTTESYSGIPQKVKKSEYKPSFLTKVGFLPTFYGSMMLKFVDPEGKRKVRTFKNFDPDRSSISDDILDKFKDSQKQLHSFIDDNQDLISSRKIIPSPISNLIFYHFDTVIDILVNHQKRHLKQAEEVMEML